MALLLQPVTLHLSWVCNSIVSELTSPASWSPEPYILSTSSTSSFLWDLLKEYQVSAYSLVDSFSLLLWTPHQPQKSGVGCGHLRNSLVIHYLGADSTPRVISRNKDGDSIPMISSIALFSGSAPLCSLSSCLTLCPLIYLFDHQAWPHCSPFRSSDSSKIISILGLCTFAGPLPRTLCSPKLACSLLLIFQIFA